MRLDITWRCSFPVGLGRCILWQSSTLCELKKITNNPHVWRVSLHKSSINGPFSIANIKLNHQGHHQQRSTAERPPEGWNWWYKKPAPVPGSRSHHAGDQHIVCSKGQDVSIFGWEKCSEPNKHDFQQMEPKKREIELGVELNYVHNLCHYSRKRTFLIFFDI